MSEPWALKKSFSQVIIENAGSPDKAVALLRSELTANPIDARLNLQVLLNTLGREPESFDVSLQLLERAPHDPRVLFNHGWHLLKREQLQRGLAYLEHGRQLGTYGHPLLASSQPLWQRGRGQGQHVLLCLEGGLGDEMIHVRFAKVLAEKYNCKVIVVCQPSLAPLFANLPRVSAIAQREAALGIYHNSWLPGMSAALALGLEFKDLDGSPYLTTSPEYQRKWQALIKSLGGKKKRIGIRWAGNPQFEHQQHRLFPPEILLQLKELEGVQLFSFQRDHALIDLPENVVDLGPHLNGWQDTAAAVEQMDLMISSCTSVAHLSAALGKETWILVPVLPYFMWAIPGESTPWYKSVKLFRQTEYDNWNSVKTNVRESLQAWLQNNDTRREKS